MDQWDHLQAIWDQVDLHQMEWVTCILIWMMLVHTMDQDPTDLKDHLQELTWMVMECLHLHRVIWDQDQMDQWDLLQGIWDQDQMDQWDILQNQELVQETWDQDQTDQHLDLMENQWDHLWVNHQIQKVVLDQDQTDQWDLLQKVETLYLDQGLLLLQMEECLHRIQ